MILLLPLLLFLSSAGSDNLVNLWRVASASSAPWLGEGLGEMEDDDNDRGGANDEDPPDIRVSLICKIVLCWCMI